jgi:hypothetical protein
VYPEFRVFQSVPALARKFNASLKRDEGFLKRKFTGFHIRHESFELGQCGFEIRIFVGHFFSIQDERALPFAYVVASSKSTPSTSCHMPVATSIFSNPRFSS